MKLSISTPLSLAAVACSAMFASCSSEQTVDVQDTRATISFATSVGRQSRSNNDDAALAAMQADPNGFKVWGNFSASGSDAKSVYMEGDAVKYQNGKWAIDGPARFWPEGFMDFYAVYPATPSAGTLHMTATDHFLADYVNDEGAEDILYCTEAKVKSDTYKKGTPVGLNFKHALSQIVFKARNTNRNITVTIEGVEVENIAKKATFTWPEKSTTNSGSGIGTWSQQNTNGSYKVVGGSRFTVSAQPQIVKGASGTGAETGSFLAIPQELTPWTTDGKNFDSKGARVLVNCKVTDTKTGIQLWPASGDYDQVAVSLGSEWNPGKRYTYTLVFGDGIGYNPKNPDKPTLVPISFDVTVDSFEDGGNF